MEADYKKSHDMPLVNEIDCILLNKIMQDDVKIISFNRVRFILSKKSPKPESQLSN